MLCHHLPPSLYIILSFVDDWYFNTFLYKNEINIAHAEFTVVSFDLGLTCNYLKHDLISDNYPWVQLI